MEEKIIKVTINSDVIELKSNNPNLKELVSKIIEQDNDYDFNSIEVNANDENFDKDSFKEILISSINDFKNKTKFVELKREETKNEIDKYKENLNESNS